MKRYERILVRVWLVMNILAIGLIFLHTLWPDDYLPLTKEIVGKIKRLDYIVGFLLSIYILLFVNFGNKTSAPEPISEMSQ